jgi:hypothetical protein
MNMYSKQSGWNSEPEAKFEPSTASKEAARLITSMKVKENSAAALAPSKGGRASFSAGEKGNFRPMSESSAKKELMFLSDLLGVSTAEGKGGDSKGADVGKFKINLFPNRAFHNSCAKAASGQGDGLDDPTVDEEDDDYSSGVGDGSGFLIMDIDGTAGSKSVEDYMKALDLKEGPSRADAKSGAKGGEDDDDLLALMDSAK